MRVSVFGLGYVGCVTAASLARAGHQVIGVDVNPEKVAMLNEGRSPIVESGLDVLLAEVVRGERLRATTSSGDAVSHSDLALICVGTPGRANGQLDVQAVTAVGRQIGHALADRSDPFTVVLRSTVLPGTTDTVLVPALRDGAGAREDLRVAVNPEFIREGSALRDFAAPPFTLVGCDDPATGAGLRELYGGVEAVLETRRRRIGVVGLAFKQGTDDLRESPMVTLVETLIGKGCDVRILDRNVSIARLVGANRRYIEEEIPHIASLMCRSAAELLRHAEVLVIGTDGEEAAVVLSGTDGRHVVIDLTRGAARPR